MAIAFVVITVLLALLLVAEFAYLLFQGSGDGIPRLTPSPAPAVSLAMTRFVVIAGVVGLVLAFLAVQFRATQ